MGPRKFAASGSNVYIVLERFDNIGKNSNETYTRSTDNGNTFGSLINISNDISRSLRVNVLAFSNDVYITWQGNGTGNYSVLYRGSNDNGATLFPPINEAPVNLSGNIAVTEPGNGALGIVAPGSNVYVAWADNSRGNLEIFLRVGI